MKRLSFAFILLLQFAAVFSQSITPRAKLLQILENYDRFVVPSEVNGKAVQVTSNMFIRSIDVVDEDANAVDMQITFRMEWKDPRLSYDRTNAFTFHYVSLTDPDMIWTPDVFFSNAKTGFRNSLLKPNILIRIYPDGYVLYSSRVTLQLTCQPQPQMFPFDKLNCAVIFASYGMTADQLNFKWKDMNPVQISSNLHLLNFDLSRFTTGDCSSRTATGEYSCLKANLFYERTPFRSYFFYLYLPSLCLVILSWLTFFINRRASDIVRLTLTLTFTLLMALICTALWHIRPHYAYINPADVWVFVSAIFVVYALVHYVAARYVPCLSGSSGEDLMEFGDKPNEPFLKVSEEKEMKMMSRSQRVKHLFQKNKADVVARLLYPVTYIIFAVIYSIYYMN